MHGEALGHGAVHGTVYYAWLHNSNDGDMKNPIVI